MRLLPYVPGGRLQLTADSVAAIRPWRQTAADGRLRVSIVTYCIRVGACATQTAGTSPGRRCCRRWFLLEQNQRRPALNRRPRLSRRPPDPWYLALSQEEQMQHEKIREAVIKNFAKQLDRFELGEKLAKATGDLGNNLAKAGDNLMNVWDFNDLKDDTLEMQEHVGDIKEDLDKHVRGAHEVVDRAKDAMGKAKGIVGDHILRTGLTMQAATPRLLENLSLRACRDSPTRDLPEGTVRQLSTHAPRRSAAPRQRNRAQCPCGATQGLLTLSACVVCLLAYLLASAEGAAAQYQERRQMPATGGKWPHGPAAHGKAVLWCRGGGPRHVLAQDDSPQHSTGKGKDDDVHDAILPSASSSAANKPGTRNHDDEKFAVHPVQSSSSQHTPAARNAMVLPGMPSTMPTFFRISDSANIPPSVSEADTAEQSTCAGIAVPGDKARLRPPASGKVSAEAGVGVYADGDCVANLHTEMRRECSTLYRDDFRLRDVCVVLEPRCRETQWQQPSETDDYAPRRQRRKKSSGAAGGGDQKRFLSWQCQFVSEDGQVRIFFFPKTFFVLAVSICV